MKKNLGHKTAQEEQPLSICAFGAFSCVFLSALIRG